MIRGQWNSDRAAKRRTRWLACAALLALSVSRPVAAQSAAVAGPAMRMYRDPITGAIGHPPAGGEVGNGRAAQQLEPALPALREEPITGPTGGYKVDLQGRFRAAVTRHAEASGTAVHECGESAAGAQWTGAR
jgi:hypothetical protein